MEQGRNITSEDHHQARRKQNSSQRRRKHNRANELKQETETATRRAETGNAKSGDLAVTLANFFPCKIFLLEDGAQCSFVLPHQLSGLALVLIIILQLSCESASVSSMQLVNTISQVPAWHLSFASMNVNVSWLPSGNLHLHLRTRHTKNNEASRMCHITSLYAKGVFCVCSHNEPMETSFRTKTCIADSNGENELQYSAACRDSASFSGLLLVQPRLVSPV